MQKTMKTAKRKCNCYRSYKLETYRPTCTLCSQLARISGFQPITQTNKWCHIFGQKSSTRFVHNVAWWAKQAFAWDRCRRYAK